MAAAASYHVSEYILHIRGEVYPEHAQVTAVTDYVYQVQLRACSCATWEVASSRPLGPN